MKTLRQICAVLVLILALTTSVFAGNMTTMITDPPPPSSATVGGQMDTGVADPATEVALSLLQSLLALL
jgi:hypothetical protein